MLIAASQLPRSKTSIDFEVFSIRQSLVCIRSQLANAIRHLSDIRNGIERQRIADDELMSGITNVLIGLPQADGVINGLHSAGGPRKYYRRLSFALINRHAEFSRWLKIMTRVEGDRAALDAALQDLLDASPGGLGTPDQVYFWICGGGPAAWALTVAVAAGVFLLDDDQTDDPEAPEEDEEDGGDEDADGDICYPGDGLDPISGTCMPEQPPD